MAALSLIIKKNSTAITVQQFIAKHCDGIATLSLIIKKFKKSTATLSKITY